MGAGCGHGGDGWARHAARVGRTHGGCSRGRAAAKSCSKRQKAKVQGYSGVEATAKRLYAAPGLPAGTPSCTTRRRSRAETAPGRKLLPGGNCSRAPGLPGGRDSRGQFPQGDVGAVRVVPIDPPAAQAHVDEKDLVGPAGEGQARGETDSIRPARQTRGEREEGLGLARR
jgi:hypothetical protein